MNRIVITVALSIALVACSHTSGQGKNYTITRSLPPRPTSMWQANSHFGYVHVKHARDWVVYELSSSEVCAEQSSCGVFWFDKEVPEFLEKWEEDEKIEQWQEDEVRSALVVIFFTIGGEVVWQVDCEFIDVPDADRTDPEQEVHCISEMTDWEL